MLRPAGQPAATPAQPSPCQRAWCSGYVDGQTDGWEDRHGSVPSSLSVITRPTARAVRCCRRLWPAPKFQLFGPSWVRHVKTHCAWRGGGPGLPKLSNLTGAGTERAGPPPPAHLLVVTLGGRGDHGGGSGAQNLVFLFEGHSRAPGSSLGARAGGSGKPGVPLSPRPPLQSLEQPAPGRARVQPGEAAARSHKVGQWLHNP